MGNTGQSTTQQQTVYTPSPFDEQKGETVRQLRALLFPAMTPQLAGAMTDKSQMGLERTNKAGVSSAAGAGLSPGSENLLSMLSAGKGDKTSALNMALGLYGYGSTGKPSSSTTGKASPSGAQVAGAMGGLGGSLYGLGKEAYEMYNNWQNEGYQNFDYGPNTALTGNAETGQWLVNDPAGAGAGAGAETGDVDMSEVTAQEEGGGDNIWEMIMQFFTD